MDLSTYIKNILAGLPPSQLEVEFDLCLDERGKVMNFATNHIKFTLQIHPRATK